MAKMTRSVLSGMCGLAARHDAMDRNPVRDTQVISQPRRPAPKSLTVKEVRQLRALMTYDDKAVERDLPEFVSFMLATGLRIGEASAVTWAAVDLDAERVEVRGTVVRLTVRGWS
jgi:site-specific recombinase XerC